MHFYGCKKYMLLIPTLILVWVAAWALMSWTSGDIDWKACFGVVGTSALFYCGFLIWASLEADGDKEWIAKTDQYLAKRGDASSQERWQSLEQILSSANQDNSTDESSLSDDGMFLYVEEVDWDEPAGVTRALWQHMLQNAFISGGGVLIIQSWSALRNLNVVNWVFPLVLLFWLAAMVYMIRKERGKTIYPILEPATLPQERCVYRTSNFYQHHQRLLGDAGWFELGDYKRVVNQVYSRMAGTFFINPSCDVIVEVGQRSGSLVYAIRTLTEAGSLYETNSLFSDKSTEHYTVRECRLGFEKAIKQHARWMAEFAESGVAFVVWNEAVIKKVMSSRRFVSPIVTLSADSESKETRQDLLAIKSV